MNNILNDYIRWMEYSSPTKKQYSPKTVKNHSLFIEKFLNYFNATGHSDLNIICVNATNDFLMEYQSKKNIQGTSMNQYRQKLRAFDTYLYNEKGLINIFYKEYDKTADRWIRVKKFVDQNQKVIVPLKYNEIQLMRKLEPKLINQIILDVIFHTAFRESEVCDIQICDLDVIQNVLYVVRKGQGKTSTEIPIELTQNLLKIYNTQKVKSPYILATAKGRKRESSHIYEIIENMVKRTGLYRDDSEFRITPHLIRKSVAIAFHKVSGSDVETATFLGQKNTKTLPSYLTSKATIRRSTIANIAEAMV
jgi:integrase